MLIATLTWILNLLAVGLFGGYIVMHQPNITTAVGLLATGIYNRARRLLRAAYIMALVQISVTIVLFCTAIISYNSGNIETTYGAIKLAVFFLFVCSMVNAFLYFTLKEPLKKLGGLVPVPGATTVTNTAVEILERWRSILTILTMASALIASFMLVDISWKLRFIEDAMAVGCLVLIGISSATTILAEKQKYTIFTYPFTFILTTVLCILAYVGHANPAFAHGTVQLWRNSNAYAGSGSQSASLNFAPGNVGLYRQITAQPNTDILSDTFETTGKTLPEGRICFLGTEAENKVHNGINIVRGFCPDIITRGAILSADKKRSEWIWFILQDSKEIADPLKPKDKNNSHSNIGSTGGSANTTQGTILNSEVKTVAGNEYEVTVPAQVGQVDTATTSITIPVHKGQKVKLISVTGDSYGARSSDDTSYGPFKAGGAGMGTINNDRKHALAKGSSFMAMAIKAGNGALPTTDGSWTLFGKPGDTYTVQADGFLHFTIVDADADENNVAKPEWRSDNSGGQIVRIRVE